jgi:predicted nucleic acid-binding protein
MKGDRQLEFLDANILVYALDATAGAKQHAAAKLIARLWESGTGCLSVQVLQEFFVTITRKVPHPLSTDEALERVREFTAWTVFAPAPEDVAAAVLVHKTARLSYWYAMIVHAARELGCDLLWSEDLEDGQLLSGVRIRNPFKTAS